jgi:HEPN domain-containing protein
MQRTEDWLREAEAELRAARDLLASGHWAWCCFTCHQAAEKALKAVGEHFRARPMGHNLNLLLQHLETFVAIPDEVRYACGRLNRYYIPTRYPDAFDQGVPAEQFFEPDAQEAINDAEQVLAFARRIIGAP